MKALVVALFLTTQAMAGIICETKEPGSAIVVNLVKTPNPGPLSGTLRYLPSQSAVVNCKFNQGEFTQKGSRPGLITTYSLTGGCTSSAGIVPFEFQIKNVSGPQHFGSTFTGHLSVAGQYTQILCHVGGNNPL